MLQLLHELLATVISAVIAFTVSGLRSGAARRWLVGRVSQLTGIGIQRVYAQQQLAGPDLARDFGRARWVKVMTGRGNELTRDTFGPVWRAAGARLESVQVLLPDPRKDDGWLIHRAHEISRRDPAYRPDVLRAQVAANVNFLVAVASDTPGIDVRLFDLPQTCRTVITDRLAYLTLYSAYEHGRTSPCYVFDSQSPMYAYALRLFTVAWDSARAAR